MIKFLTGRNPSRKAESQSRRISSLFQFNTTFKQGPPKREKNSALGHGTKRFPIGLDLDLGALKWVMLGLIDGKVSIVGLGHQPLNNLSALAETQRQTRLREGLQRVVTQHGLAGEVVLSLPVEDVNLQILKLPVLPEAELEQAIRWQVEQALPPQISYDGLSVDHVVLHDIGCSWESRVLVASVPRQRTLAMVDLVQNVGLKPIAIDIDPFALVAGLAQTHRFRESETALVLHLGISTASLSVVTKGQLAFCRSLLTTDRTLIQAVAEHLRISWDEAEKLKQKHGLLGASGSSTAPLSADIADQASTVAHALSSPLENLIVDILHAFKSFSHQVTQSQTQRFDQVYLSGEAVQLPGLVSWLQSRLQVSVEIVNPLSFLPMLDSIGSVESWSPMAPQFAIAMGLALREVPT